MTQDQLDVGRAAAHTYLKQVLGWREFLAHAYEPNAVELIVKTADATVGDVPTKEHAAGAALYKAIADQGYGEQVTPSQCAVLAHVVCQAVVKERVLKERDT